MQNAFKYDKFIFFVFVLEDKSIEEGKNSKGGIVMESCRGVSTELWCELLNHHCVGLFITLSVKQKQTQDEKCVKTC